MKRYFYFICALLLVTSCIQAQDDGIGLSTSARKALNAYMLDQNNNGAKLEEAKTLINQGLQFPSTQATGAAWITKGDIYIALVGRDLNKQLTNRSLALTGDNDALVAFNAYKKGYELSVANDVKKEALRGFQASQRDLINITRPKFEAGEFEKALFSQQAALQCHELLKANGQQSILDDPSTYFSHIQLTAMAALSSNHIDDALVYYEWLTKAGTEYPSDYEGLYMVKDKKGDEAGAFKVLQEGRQRFPNDNGLLFAEINYLLKKERLDELIGKIRQAIAQEPTNIGLYTTLGTVYDHLYQRELAANQLANAATYFKEAENNYTIALQKDPNNIEAVYSFGALYYNKAAAVSKEMNALPEDYSKEGLQRLKEKKDAIFAFFDKALFYFQQVESVDPNDLNTLVALTEIYTRKNDEKAAEFKKRLELVKAGGRNSQSFFSR